MKTLTHIDRILLTFIAVAALTLGVTYVYVQTHVSSTGAAALCNYPGEAHPLPVLQPCFK